MSPWREEPTWDSRCYATAANPAPNTSGSWSSLPRQPVCRVFSYHDPLGAVCGASAVLGANVIG